MTRRGSSRLWAALVGLVLLGAACARPVPSAAGASRAVRVLLPAYPSSLSLIGKTESNAEQLAALITDSLVQYDPDLALQPRVAESYDVSEDGLTWTFRLREGVRWHDGAPVTADDVVFTVNKVLEPATDNRVWGPLFADLVSVEALDAHTVRAVYSRATPDLLEGWRVPLLPRHVAGADADLFNGAYARDPVGCGPFRHVSHEQDREILLEANDDYWDGRPHIDRLLLRVFADQQTAYEALIAGELDVAVLTGNLWQDAMRSGRAATLESTTYDRLATWMVLWNTRATHPLFHDARVRRAMVLALDRERFARTVALGLARPGVTSYHPGTVWADRELAAWPYDPERAKALLTEAGWVDRDGDGVRERDGVPFRFTLIYGISPQQIADQMAAWQQESWAAIGVRTEIERLEFQTYRERRNSFRFDAAVGTLIFTPNPDQLFLYHSSAAAEGGSNFSGVADAELDRLLEQGQRTFDPERRAEIYRAVQRRLHELEPVSSLFYFSSPIVYDKRLHGLRASPLGFFVTTEGPRLWSWEDED